MTSMCDFSHGEELFGVEIIGEPVAMIRVIPCVFIHNLKDGTARVMSDYQYAIVDTRALFKSKEDALNKMHEIIAADKNWESSEYDADDEEDEDEE